MPTYVYKFVETGETIEVQQSFSDDSLTEAAHPESGEVMAVKKVFQPVGVTFKGSGFFKTDNRNSSSKRTTGNGAAGGGGSESSGSGSSDTKTDSSTSTGDSSSGASSSSSSTSSTSSN